MKTKKAFFLYGLHIICVIIMLAGPEPVRAQGTAFTYQGRLTADGSAANGSYDLTFSLFDSDSAGNQVGSTLENLAVNISNGLFVTTLDFGSGVFDGSARWLEIGVRTNGSSGAYTTLAARQSLTPAPYAIWAANAATATDVNAGAVVKSLNALKDDVTLQAGANVTITPSGNILRIDAATGGGTSIWSLLNGNAYYNAGNVGIGTNAPHHRLRISGGPLWTAYSWSGSLELDNASAIGWRSNAGGQRFGIGQSTGGLYFFRTTSDPGTTGSPALYDMELSDGGNLLVGNPLTDVAGIPLQVNGLARVSPGGSGGYVQFHTPAGETGMSIIGANRADVRFDGSTLKLLAGVGPGAMPSQNGIAINTNGNVGIGTTTPFAKLNVNSAGDAIYAVCTAVAAVGVFGQSTGTSGVGLYGLASGSNAEGVHGESSGSGAAVNGTSSSSGTGVYGTSASGYAGYFAGPVLTTGRITANAGISASSSGSPAGSFLGNVSISGNLTVSGSVTKSSGTFKIDHPLDPANKFLSHSFVESPDMMNIYNGNVALDDKGEAVVPLPEWFGSLNKDFRYQLTAVGAPAPGLYIAEEIAGNQFKIAGGKRGGKVSWQVTGVRQDAFANAHRTPVEEEKTGTERGTYLHPELFVHP
jgi:hypothetical protein